MSKDGTVVVGAIGTLKTATVPSGATTIQEAAFAEHAAITNVSLVSGMTTIGAAAFSNATQFASITIPPTVTTIGANAFFGTALATVYVANGDTSRVRTLVSGTGYSTEGVDFVESQPAPQPSIEGDPGATVTGDAENGYTVTPSTTDGTVTVNIPSGLAASKVTVAVPSSAKVKLNGANVKVMNNGHDIYGSIDLPAAVDGVVDLSKSTIKQSVVDAVLDPEDSDVNITLTPSAPSITTAKTVPGLTYVLVEGATIETMAPGVKDTQTMVGNGETFTPEITVKGGTSGFYSIKVTK